MSSRSILFISGHLNGKFAVNFTNILRAAFTLADPKSAKKLLNLTAFFALLVSAGVKAARRTLMKLTRGGGCTSFTYVPTFVRSLVTSASSLTLILQLGRLNFATEILTRKDCLFKPVRGSESHLQASSYSGMHSSFQLFLWLELFAMNTLFYIVLHYVWRTQTMSAIEFQVQNY